MGILKIPEERRLIVEPPVGELAAREGLVETTVAESVMPLEIALDDVTGSKVNSPGVPTVKVSSADTTVAEATTLGITYTETAKVMMIITEVATVDISAPPCNDHNSQTINFHLLFLISELLQKP